MLWIRDMKTGSSRTLPSTELANDPFWSPDGKYVAFFSTLELRRVNVGSGLVETVCGLRASTPGAASGTWLRTREGLEAIIFQSRSDDTVLFSVSPSGGEPRQISRHDVESGEYNHSSPWSLGRFVFYRVTNREPEKTGIYVAEFFPDQDLSRGKMLAATDRFLAISQPSSADGSAYLLYELDSRVIAQRIESGNPTEGGDRLRLPLQTPPNGFSTAPNGLLVAPELDWIDSQLAIVDRKGETVRELPEEGKLFWTELAPDGRSVAVVREEVGDNTRRLWILDLLQGSRTRLTVGSEEHRNPTWSRDGKQLLFSHADQISIGKKQAYGVEASETLYQGASLNRPYDTSPDGEYLLFAEVGETSQSDLWILKLDSGQQPEPFSRTDAYETQGRFSPNARWIAYSSNESGSYEIYVQPFPATGERWTVSTAGGVQPLWRADGAELYFIEPPGSVMGVSVRGGERFEWSKPEKLFEFQPAVGRSFTIGYLYGVWPDGKQFLVNRHTESGGNSRLRVLVNWQAALE